MTVSTIPWYDPYKDTHKIIEQIRSEDDSPPDWILCGERHGGSIDSETSDRTRNGNLATGLLKDKHIVLVEQSRDEEIDPSKDEQTKYIHAPVNRCYGWDDPNFCEQVHDFNTITKPAVELVCEYQPGQPTTEQYLRAASHLKQLYTASCQKQTAFTSSQQFSLTSDTNTVLELYDIDNKNRNDLTQFPNPEMDSTTYKSAANQIAKLIGEQLGILISETIEIRQKCLLAALEEHQCGIAFTGLHHLRIPKYRATEVHRLAKDTLMKGLDLSDKTFVLIKPHKYHPNPKPVIRFSDLFSKYTESDSKFGI